MMNFVLFTVLCDNLSAFHDMVEHTDYLCGSNAESFHHLCFQQILARLACVCALWMVLVS